MYLVFDDAFSFSILDVCTFQFAALLCLQKICSIFPNYFAETKILFLLLQGAAAISHIW
jgi:hypothetical protein